MRAHKSKIDISAIEDLIKIRATLNNAMSKLNIPNKETIEAIEEGEQMIKDIKAGKNVPCFKSIEELNKDLNS